MDARSVSLVRTVGSSDVGNLEVQHLGELHQQWLDAEGVRKSGGAYYTPIDIVRELLHRSLEPLVTVQMAHGPHAVAALRVLDPACGSGNFLIEAARIISSALVASGLSIDESNTIAFGSCVVGIDIDEHAVDIARYCLDREAGGRDPSGAITGHVFHTDALTLPPRSEPGSAEQMTPSWESVRSKVGAERGFDLVIGNPPFLNQLENATTNSRAYAASLRARFGDNAGGYTDPAALFLLLAAEQARPDGGIVCMIEPLSLLSARGAGKVRGSVLNLGWLRSLWLAESRVFDASVDVCAVFLERGGDQSRTQLISGRSFVSTGSAPALEHIDKSWSALVATARGVPDRALPQLRTLRAVADATADFRDQYYGLAPHMIDTMDHADAPRLVTAGLIDPAHLLWGQRSTKFNKQLYTHPRVQLSGLDDKLRRWANQRLVPKLLVATQTRVLEVIVDEAGDLLPSVPVVTVLATGASLWHIGAVLSCPPVTMVAARRHLGAALNADALKLSASDVLELPIPEPCAAWDAGAESYRLAFNASDPDERRRHLLRSGQEMCAAYALSDDADLLDWWTQRFPPGRQP
jgi:hypothetical protein